MATPLDHLLPAPDDAVRCAEHARRIAVDPGGTAIRADRLILVETPAPWPKPALAHERLADLAALVKAGPVPTRLLAALADGAAPVPADDASGQGIAVVVYDRVGAGAVRRRFRTADVAQLVAWGTALVADDDLSPWADGAAMPAPPAVLICTQGSHDVCCGSEGARFAAEVEEAMSVDVYRVSHTGGHRFAPTALTLPDGRMWADLDLDGLRAVLAGVGDIEAMVDRCRGWWGADTGPAQVAERAVLAEVGWALNDLDRTVAVAEPGARAEPVATTDPGPGPTIEVVVQADGQAWTVELAAGRLVPTIACRQPGGLPTKQAQEYEVRSVTRT